MNEYYMIDPQTYDDQFWWKKDDIEFWKSVLIANDATILELAAGTGRLGIPLVREGAQYTGLELSTEYVKYANLKFPCKTLFGIVIRLDKFFTALLVPF